MPPNANGSGTSTNNGPSITGGSGSGGGDHGDGKDDNDKLTNGSTTGTTGRPSDARRKLLNDELAVPIVSNFFPLDRYYDAAQTVYAMTCDTYEADMLDDAYLYGKRYCTFFLDAIPTHNYYNQQRYRTQLVQHTKQVARILDILEKVALRMDEEEIEKQRIEEERIQKERYEEEQKALRQFEQLSIQHQQSQYRLNQQQKTATKTNASDIQMSAFQKLALLSNNNNNNNNGSSTSMIVPPVPTQKERIPKDPSGDKDDTSKSYYNTNDQYLNQQQQQQQQLGSSIVSLSAVQPLPPPYIVPNPTETGQQQQQQHEQQLKPPSYDSISVQQRRKNTAAASSSSSTGSNNTRQPPIRQLVEHYIKQYNAFQKAGKIQVTTLGTYQGRVSDSINGCTVISALVAATHLQGTVSDTTVCTIIDSKAGPILREIRNKLGLSNGALIIPSDVHDHMVDKKIFYQEQFVDVIGGNILDRNHYGEFLKLLAIGNGQNNDPGTSLASVKTSATLFFREHVISIIKTPLPGGGGSCYYDLIDSMPGGTSGRYGSGATRTRCVDVASLEIVLQWYATRKLAPPGTSSTSSSNNASLATIDKHPWNDANADFDPRVFQGFVWKTISQ